MTLEICAYSKWRETCRGFFLYCLYKTVSLPLSHISHHETLFFSLFVFIMSQTTPNCSDLPGADNSSAAPPSASAPSPSIIPKSEPGISAPKKTKSKASVPIPRKKPCVATSSKGKSKSSAPPLRCLSRRNQPPSSSPGPEDT